MKDFTKQAFTRLGTFDAAGYTCTVFETALPFSVKGFTGKGNGEKDAIIVLNDNLNDAEKRETLAHEIAHIEQGHIDCTTKSVPEMEAEAEERKAFTFMHLDRYITL